MKLRINGCRGEQMRACARNGRRRSSGNALGREPSDDHDNCCPESEMSEGPGGEDGEIGDVGFSLASLCCLALFGFGCRQGFKQFLPRTVPRAAGKKQFPVQQPIADAIFNHAGRQLRKVWACWNVKQQLKNPREQMSLSQPRKVEGIGQRGVVRRQAAEQCLEDRPEIGIPCC